MPQFLLEVPEGVGVDAKQKMMRGITAAIDEAYGGAPDVRIWLREYASENVAQDGRINAEPIRPLEHVGWAGRLQSDNPEMVEAVKQLNG